MVRAALGREPAAASRPRALAGIRVRAVRVARASDRLTELLPALAADHQATGPFRSRKRPVPAAASSVARATMASVPSVTVWWPLLPLRSVAV